MLANNKVCPRCGVADIRPSSYQKAIDHLLRFLLLVPFRCRICLHRFFRYPY